MAKRAIFLLFVLSAAVFVFSAAAFGATEPASQAHQAHQELHDRAKNLYDVADYRAALNLYERILEQNPEDGAALDLSGWCLRYLNDRKSSEETFKKALTMLQGQDAVWVLIGLGELYLDGELYDEALQRLEEALSAAPENQEASERAFRGIELAKAALVARAQAEIKTQKTQPVKTLTNAEDRQKDAFRDKPSEPEPNQEPAPNKEPVEPARKEPKKKPAPQPDKTNNASELAPVSAKTQEKVSAPASASASTRTQGKPSAPQKPAETPPGRAATVVYGVTLGANIDEALAALEKAGYPAVDKPFTQKGRIYHPVRGFSVALPSSLREGLAFRQYYVTDYNEGVLSLIVQLDYGRDRSFDDLKNALQEAFSGLTGRKDTRGVKVSDNLFSYEMGLALSNTHGVWAYVTDKGNGTCRLEIEHIDLTNLSHYWMAGGR